MNRRYAIAAGAAGAAILALLAGLWLARAPLAAWIGREILERRGIAAEFDIVRLDWEGAVLRDVRLGDQATIPLLEADWRLGELIGGRIRAVRLTRPQARVILDADGVQVAGFRIGDGGGAAPNIGLVSVTNALVTVASEAGVLPVELDLEGGPDEGWRGWAMATPGAVAWRGWRADVESAEAEFDMVGGGLLARTSLTLSDIAGPRGTAGRAAVAATARLQGLEQGFANATGEAAVNAMARDARAADPDEEARRLIAAERWEEMRGAGPLAEPLADRLAAALADFGADMALYLDVTPQTLNVALQAPLRIDSADGPDATVRPLDDPEAGLVFSYGRDGRGWRLQANMEVANNPNLTARVVDVRMSDGLSALRFEGSLAPFGTEDAMIGADDLSADWQRTANGWRVASTGGARFSGEMFGLSARGARIDGAFTLTNENGAMRMRPQTPDESARVSASAFATQTTQFENLALEIVPNFDLGDGEWRIDPGAAPVRLSSGAILLGAMRLRGVAFEAPDGGILMSGRGGQFTLQKNGGPARVALAAAEGEAWSARGAAAAQVTGAGGPLLERTADGVTFLNASAAALTAESFRVAGNTHFRGVVLRDAHLSGPVNPEMELDVSAPAASATLDTLGRTDMAFGSGRLSAVLSLAPGAPLSARFAVADGALAGGTLPMELSRARVSGAAEFGSTLRADIDIENAVIGSPGDRPLIAPAALSGGLSADNGLVRMTLSGAAPGAAANSILVTLNHNLRTGVGEANIDIPRIVFTPRGAQPQDMVGALKGLVADVSGPAEAHFTAQWYGAAMRSSGVVVLDGLDFATRFGPVQDVTTRFELSSLAPLLTAEPQTVTMGAFNPGVQVESGVVSIMLLPDRKIGLVNAAWPFAGGTISLAPFVWDPAEAEHRAALVADRVNLTQLVSMFHNPSLSAAGTVSGRMPILIANGDIEIEDALLTGDEEGFLSYRGEASEAAAQANEQANLAFRALENLRYRVLEVRLDGPVAGEMELVVNVEGFNPDVLNGYPFRFRIALAAELMHLIRESTQGFRIRQQIERALENGGFPAEGDGPAPPLAPPPARPSEESLPEAPG